MNTIKEGFIIGLLSEFLNVWAARDIDELMAYISSDATLYGTGQDEKRVGRDEIRFQIERDFAQSESLTCELNWSQVGMSDSVAWAASDVTIAFKAPGMDEMEFPARLTTVWQHRDGRWLIEHFHLSVAAANQEEGQSF